MAKSNAPQCIAAMNQVFISLEPKQSSMASYFPNEEDVQIPVYANLRRHCKLLHRTALSRLHLQMALYMHPVIRGDELAISKGATTMPKLGAPRCRHLAEAELRSVYTMFIKALISPQLTGSPQKDSVLFKALGNIMHVTSRELDRYSGQLRQFIVDDKGWWTLVVLIGPNVFRHSLDFSFFLTISRRRLDCYLWAKVSNIMWYVLGLSASECPNDEYHNFRGSTFPNM
jgi:hypothetical protein